MLPAKYQWLDTVGTLPKLVSAGLQYLGVREIPGAQSNPVILDMAKGLNVSTIYTNDDLSWCALFINHLMRISGKPPVDPKNDKFNYLRAKWMLNWGNPVPKEEAKLGDLMIFTREGGGHVGLYIGESATTYHILGGNQGNCVCFTEIAKNRLDGVRRFYATAPPASVKEYKIDSSGIVSTNEG